MSATHEYDQGLHCLDLGFQGRAGVIASYLLEDAGERALIETGPSSTIESLLAALDILNIEPDSISKLLVTHIHLDHSGAAGLWMRRFPQAHLYAHEIGVPHLVDPTKLLASATRIYGDMMGPLWGPVEPVPEDRLTALTENDVVTVGNGSLKVLYTPGHASHHVAYYDERRSAVFTGDVAAVRLQGQSYVRPPTPPPDLDLEAWTRSIERLRDLHPNVLYLTHFGGFYDIDRHLTDAGRRLYEWSDLVRKAKESGQDRPELTDTLRLYADRELLQTTNDAGVVQNYDLATPYGMSVDGYLRYFRGRSA